MRAIIVYYCIPHVTTIIERSSREEGENGCLSQKL